MRPLVFLDIDGVLNPHNFDPDPMVMSGRILWGNVRHLNRVLRGADAEVVLSSAWRYQVLEGASTLKGFEYLLRSHGVACADRLVGLTCPDEVLVTRGGQIQEYLTHEPGDRPYCVIDDGWTDPDGVWHDLGIEQFGLKVVWTRPDLGITREDADRAMEVLTGAPVPCGTCRGNLDCPGCGGDGVAPQDGSWEICRACDGDGWCQECSFDRMAEAARKVKAMQEDRAAARAKT